MGAELNDNFEHLDSLIGQGQDVGGGYKTVSGIVDSDTEPMGGFVVTRKPKPLDIAPESIKNAFIALRPLAPSAGIAGLGALAAAPFGPAAGAGAAGALGAKAIYDTVSGLVVNPLSRLFTDKELLPSSNVLFDKAMDKLGVPYPKTDEGRAIQNIARAGADTFAGGPALGKILAEAASAGPVMKAVGAEMQASPGMQVLGGMAGQSAVEAIDPSNQYPTVDILLSLLGSMAPRAARGVPSALFGKRDITPAYQDAMRSAFDARNLDISNSGMTMNPSQVSGFIRDAESNGALSAGVKGFLEGRGFFQPMMNRIAVSDAEKSILTPALKPSGAVENINQAQGANFDQIPGYRPTSSAAANDEGVASALSVTNPNPRIVQRANLNNEAINKFATEIGRPIPGAEGAYEQAASARQAEFIDPAVRQLADSQNQIYEQQRLLREIQAQKDLAQAELARVQGQVSEYAPAATRGEASKAGFEEFFGKTKKLNDYMEASKLPSELEKPIPTTPLVEGIQQSKGISATALENPNPEVSSTEQHLKRFGVDPSASPSEPSMGKTVIAAEPAAMGPASAMTPERAAEIEAAIKAIPASKGMSKYLEDLGGPVESTIKTPGGKMVSVRRKLVELEDVVRGGKSEAHPAEYQNRDRSTAASQNQVNEIVGRFNPPEITGSNPVATSGAPIVGPHGNVLEGGHARMSALERVLTEPGNAAQREAYIAELKKAGHDVSGFKNPVEVQERVTPMTPQEVQGFVQDLNRPSVSALSTSDMAKGDAVALGKSIGKLDPTKPLDHPANADFVRSMNSTQLGSTEYASYLKPDGTPNTALVKRYNDALSQAAYGGKSAAADTLLRSLRDDSDTMVNTIASAMEDAAGGVARLRSEIDAGKIPKEYDLGSKIAEAASFVREARKEGIHPLEALNQPSLIGGPDNQTRALVELFYNEGSRRQVGGKALGQTLTQMAAEAMQQDSGLGIGGGLTPDQIIQRGKQAIGSRASAAASTEPSMAKATEAAPVTAPSETAAVSVASAPAEEFKVKNAVAKLDSLKAKMRAAERTGGVEWANAKKELQPLIDNLEDQVRTHAPTLWESKENYAKLAEAYKHGKATELLKAGQNGDPHNIHPTKAFDLWFDSPPSEKDAKQFAALFGDTPQGVDNVRQYAISHLASNVGEDATGSSIRAWLNGRDYIFHQPEFKAVGEEIRRFANQLDNHSATINQAGKDFVAETQRLSELKSLRGEAESSLAAQRKTSEEAGSFKIASGKIDSVLSDPVAAREAVGAANTPAARQDLDNKIRAKISEKIKNTGVTAARPTSDEAVTADQLNASMAKTIKATLEGNGRESLEILTSPEHVRRLDMLVNALEAESKQTKLTRGTSLRGSDTTQLTAVQRLAQASSSFYRRITTTVLQALGDTATAANFLADVQLNPELLKQILLMHKENDATQINRWIESFAKKSGRIAGTAGQFGSDWRKRERDSEESGESPKAPDEKE